MNEISKMEKVEREIKIIKLKNMKNVCPCEFIWHGVIKFLCLMHLCSVSILYLDFKSDQKFREDFFCKFWFLCPSFSK